MTDNKTMPAPVAGNPLSLAVEIVRAVCDLDEIADPDHDDTICVTMQDLEAVIENRLEASKHFAASQLQAALDRAERAEKERDAYRQWRDQHAAASRKYRDLLLSATTAEAALAEARKAFDHIDALDPEEHIYGCSTDALRGLIIRMGQSARQWLSAHPAKETKG